MAGILDTPQSLMPSLEGVNAEKVINKSSSGTAMQDLSHPKAKTKTDRMKKNKQNPTPSQPKPFKNVKITRSKKTVAKSYTAEDLEATADELQILDTSRSVDQQHPTLDNQTLRVLELHSAFRVTKSQNKKNLKVLTFEEADKSSLVSLGQRDEDFDTSKVLSPQDESLADDIIEELVDLKATSEVEASNVHVFATPMPEMTSSSDRTQFTFSECKSTSASFHVS
ncbi:hypothetical protein Tco_1099085 [Tanacetum coccineum]